MSSVNSNEECPSLAWFRFNLESLLSCEEILQFCSIRYFRGKSLLQIYLWETFLLLGSHRPLKTRRLGMASKIFAHLTVLAASFRCLFLPLLQRRYLVGGLGALLCLKVKFRKVVSGFISLWQWTSGDNCCLRCTDVVFVLHNVWHNGKLVLHSVFGILIWTCSK